VLPKWSCSIADEKNSLQKHFVAGRAAVGILYGAVARLVFTYSKFEVYFGVMTIGFIFLVPLALGALAVHVGEKQKKRGWTYWIFMPWVSCCSYCWPLR